MFSSAIVTGRGVQLFLLTVVVAAAGTAWAAVGPVQETMRVALGLSDNQMAVLQGPALALPLALAGIVLGRAIDKTSRVRLLITFAIINIAGSLLTARAPSFTALFVGRCLVGLMMNAISIATLSLLADLYPPALRGRANMMVVIGQIGGSSAAFAFGGALVTSHSGPDGWRWAMFWLTVPLGLAVCMMMLIREPPRTGVVVEDASAPAAFAELWRYRKLLAPLWAGLVMVEMSFQAVRVWAPPTLSRSFALSPDRVGAIISVVGLVSGILGSVAGGSLADACQRTGGPRRTVSVLIGLALLSAPAALFALVPRVGVASAVLLAFMMIINAMMVITTTLLTVVAPNEVRGICIATSAAANALFGLALAPLAVSVLSGAIGGVPMIGRALAMVAVVACLAAAAIFVWGRRGFSQSAAIP